jgi:hypothetical protein
MVTELFKVAISARVLRRVGPTLSDPTKEKLMQHILNERYNKAISQIPGGVKTVPLPSRQPLYLYAAMPNMDITIPYGFKKPAKWTQIFTNPLSLLKTVKLNKNIIFKGDPVEYYNIAKQVSAGIPTKDIINRYLKLYPETSPFLTNPKFVTKNLPLNQIEAQQAIRRRIPSNRIKSPEMLTNLHELREIQSWEDIAKQLNMPTPSLVRRSIFLQRMSGIPFMRRIVNYLAKLFPSQVGAPLNTMFRIPQTGSAHSLLTLPYEIRDIQKIAPLLKNSPLSRNKFFQHLLKTRNIEYYDLLKRMSQMKPEYIQRLSPRVREAVESIIAAQLKESPLARALFGRTMTAPRGFNYLSAPVLTDNDMKVIIEGLLLNK